jgi:photosystem II stability/assembly factor-like uncharacterized protein
VLLDAVPRAGAATPGRWRPIGASIDGTPVGDANHLAGRVSAVAVVPGPSVTEVVGTLGGIWVRTGTGGWRDVTDRAWPATAVNSIAVDPLDTQVLYAGTGYDDVDDSSVQPGNGLLKSMDGGETWAPLPASEAPMRGYAVTGIAIDPKNDQIVVAAANNGLFRSTDGGGTWTETQPITPGPYGVAEVHLAVDSVTGVMLAGVAQSATISAHRGAGSITTGHAVYESTDSGQSWTAYAVDAGTGAANVVVPGIGTTTGANPTTYAYALDVTGTGSTGLYTSSDGHSWARLTGRNVTVKFSIGQLVVDPQHPNVAYFAQESSAPYRYTYGATGTSPLTSGDGTDCGFGDFRTLALGPAITAPADEALYGGEDGGACFFDLTRKTYTDNSSGLVSGIDYFASAQSSSTELSGAQDLGVDLWKGRSSTREVYHADGYGVLIDRRRPATYFAATNPPSGPQTFITSTNSGRTWHVVRLSPAATDVYGLRLVQATGDARVLVLSQSDGTLYVSTTEGRSWVTRHVPLTGQDYLTAVRAARFRGVAKPVIYVGTGFGAVWRSIDAGKTWTRLPRNFGPLAVRDLALDTVRSRGPRAERLFLSLGAYAPQAYGTGGTLGGVWQSNNSGRSWQEIGQPLRAMSVNALVLSGSTLLAATDYGVEAYLNGGWSVAGTGLPNVRVNDLIVSADGRAFFAATYGRGTWRSPVTPAPGHGLGR